VQNHDQVGNRATGDRLTALTSPGRRRVAAALLLTGPFTPMLFQGEEWGASTPFLYFTDHHDPELGRAVSEGRRREFAHFGWAPKDVPDPQAPETFARSRLDWAELERSEHAELLSWYRELLMLRRRHPDLRDPRLDRTAVDVDNDVRTLVVRRNTMQVLVNLGDEPRPFSVQPGRRVVAASSAIEAREGSVIVPSDSAVIVR
jgi:maltooligosyltrehalose trehalohydrolase